MSAPERAPAPQQLDLQRSLGLLDTTFLVMGLVIGGGIFLTTGEMAASLPSAPLILAVWVIGGALTRRRRVGLSAQRARRHAFAAAAAAHDVARCQVLVGGDLRQGLVPLTQGGVELGLQVVDRVLELPTPLTG